MKHLVSLTLLKRQKTALWFLIAIFVVFGIVTVGMAVNSGNYFALFFNLPLCLVLPVMMYRDLKRIKSISYDDTRLYYSRSIAESVRSIAFENIRSITIGNFTGTFRINLFTPNEDGGHIYFKFPNIWNPFATKRRIAEIYKLRDSIDARKSLADEDYEGETQILRLAEV